jgi:1,4-alpha-glucan branching enzyme
MKFKILILSSLFINLLQAQVVTSIPAYATVNDSVVILFNAAEGNKGMMGYSGTDVYAHTGVITDQSTSPSDWKHVIAAWNVNLPKAKLEKVGTDLWQLTIGDVRSYYGIPLSEKVLKLAFVFRNSNGSVTGRDIGGADIFLNLYEPGITTVVINPAIDLQYSDPLRTPAFVSIGDTLPIKISSAQIGTSLDSLFLYADNILLISGQTDTLNYDFIATDFPTGPHLASAVARDTSGLADTVQFYIIVNPQPESITRPPGVCDGINYIDESTVILSLFAPYKKYVYVLGDFNNWEVSTDYFMARDEVNADSVHWWITLSGLTPGVEYAFQYLVDGELRIADPYTEKILDPWNDTYISPSTYPNLRSYPAGKTGEIVSVLETGQPAFNWIYSTDYQRPPQRDLVIYELLLRDFLAAHDFKTLQDTLNYLDSLGINAIELMPVNEFEGNSSWGYNPSFYFAVDKYYGPAGDLKRFVDECHRRGIAVILDMVLNHSFGQSPLVRLYTDDNGYPSTQNPWYYPDYNPNFAGYQARHPYGVGYDFNHNAIATQNFVDRVNSFWLKKYKIDGFRYDLTKGFTSKVTYQYSYISNGTIIDVYNEAEASNYDADRVSILKRMADKIWGIDSTAYIILEHFAINSEETELANYGMMLWGNLNYNYNEATMGYHQDNNVYGKSDFSWGYYKARGWSKPGLVTYMESHDEERLMYKNITYGNSSGNYDIKNLETALNRIKMAAAFFFTLPGPRMIWKHGELGYDYSIDYNGRLAEKPIRWDYYQDPLRQKLYKTFKALLKLRNENNIFRSSSTIVDQQLLYETKKIRLSLPGMSAVIVGNFDVTPRSIDPNFYHGGKWYDYFSGDSMLVSDNNAPLNLLAGEFHIFTDKKLATPEADILDAVEQPAINTGMNFTLQQNYPNPFNPSTTITFHLPVMARVTLKIFDLLGREVVTLINGENITGTFTVQWDGRNQRGQQLSSGVYIYTIRARAEQKLLFKQSRKMIFLK